MVRKYIDSLIYMLSMTPYLQSECGMADAFRIMCECIVLSY